MNISEKIQKIVDDMPKVYDAGYVKGQESMVDESKIIEKTVSGTGLLLIDDVSEVPHEVEVQLTSDTITDFSNTEVVVTGKNLWDKDRTDYKPSPASGYYYFPIKVGAGNAVTFSFPQTLTTGLGFYALVNVNDTGNNVTESKDWLYHSTASPLINNEVTVTAKTDFVYLVVNQISKFRTYIGNDLQIEISSIPTSYEFFIEEKYTPNPNGKVAVKSMSPIMNIYTNETDINISANYHKSYGMQLQYDLMWDAIQTAGTRKAYDFAFYGNQWDDRVFKPKYDFHPTTAKNMFRAARFEDLKACLENSGVVLDTSACTDFEMTFYYGIYGHIPEIDTRSATTLYSIFCGADAHTIDKWILKDDGSQKFNQNTFTHNSLKNLVVEGVIGQNQLSFALCTKLSKASITSIINALSSTTSGLTITLSKTAINTAFGIDVSKDESEWEGTEFYTLRHSKDNWTFSYV